MTFNYIFVLIILCTLSCPLQRTHLNKEKLAFSILLATILLYRIKKTHRSKCIMLTFGFLTSHTSSVTCRDRRHEGSSLDSSGRGSWTLLKPIKATWVCSHAWPERCVCEHVYVYSRAQAKRWPTGAGCASRLARSHMLHNRFLLSWKPSSTALYTDAR